MLIFHKKNVETTSILAFNFKDSQESPRITRFLSSKDLSRIDFSGDGFVIGCGVIGLLFGSVIDFGVGCGFSCEDVEDLVYFSF